MHPTFRNEQRAHVSVSFEPPGCLDLQSAAHDHITDNRSCHGQLLRLYVGSDHRLGAYRQLAGAGDVTVEPALHSAVAGHVQPSHQHVPLGDDGQRHLVPPEGWQHTLTRVRFPHQVLAASPPLPARRLSPSLPQLRPWSESKAAYSKSRASARVALRLLTSPRTTLGPGRSDQTRAGGHLSVPRP